jgi:acylpyruvate hydrolase
MFLSRGSMMRLVSFNDVDGSRIGLVVNNEVIDLTSFNANAPRDIQKVIANGELPALQKVATEAIASKQSHYHPFHNLDFNVPIAAPSKILCLGLNYMEHVNEGIFERQSFPTIFLRTISSMVPHNRNIIRPLNSNSLDFEAELALVIGSRSRHLTIENALDSVAGYSCSNDGTVREYQRHTIQWTMGKNFDSTGSIGPIFVTSDELPEGAKGLKIECRLNDKTVQSSNTDMMMFPVVETLVYLTEGITLEPGDIVLMGTPSGVGHARKPPLWLQDGDVVEVEIEHIGLLRNPIANEMAE